MKTSDELNVNIYYAPLLGLASFVFFLLAIWNEAHRWQWLATGIITFIITLSLYGRKR